jgi:hypothetical protein
MDQMQLFAMEFAAVVGMLAAFDILLGQRRRAEPKPPHESPFGASSEGMKRCSHCGMGSLWTNDRCMSCGAVLPGGAG